MTCGVQSGLRTSYLSYSLPPLIAPDLVCLSQKALVSMGTNRCCFEDTHNRRVILTQMSEPPHWTGRGPAISRTDMNLGLSHPTLLHTQGTHQDVGEGSPSPILPRLDDLVSGSVMHVTMGRLQTLLLSHGVVPLGHWQGHPRGWPWGSHPIILCLPLPSFALHSKPNFILYPTNPTSHHIPCSFLLIFQPPQCSVVLCLF